jgi:hypothetical protein
VVNQTFVKRFLDDATRWFAILGGRRPPDITIVGVVKDSHYSA